MFENFSVVEFVQSMGTATPFTVGIALGVVDWLGKFGVSGRGKLVASLLAGLLVGGGLVYFQLYPKTPVEWFATGLYGLVAGLTASGVYDAAKTASQKGTEKAVEEDQS